MEHCILSYNVPIAICISDQNFPACFSYKENCVPIIRLENSSLAELTDLLFKVFEQKNLPQGSVIMLGSGSILNRVGD